MFHTPRRPSRRNALPPLPRHKHRSSKPSYVELSSVKRRKIRHYPIDYASIPQFTLLHQTRPSSRLSFGSPKNISPGISSDPSCLSSPLARYTSQKDSAYMHPYTVDHFETPIKVTKLDLSVSNYSSPASISQEHNLPSESSSASGSTDNIFLTPLHQGQKTRSTPPASSMPIFNILDLGLSQNDACFDPITGLNGEDPAIHNAFCRLHLASSSSSSPNHLYPGMTCPLYPINRNRSLENTRSATTESIWDIDATQ